MGETNTAVGAVVAGILSEEMEFVWGENTFGRAHPRSKTEANNKTAILKYLDLDFIISISPYLGIVIYLPSKRCLKNYIPKIFYENLNTVTLALFSRGVTGRFLVSGSGLRRIWQSGGAGGGAGSRAFLYQGDGLKKEGFGTLN